MGNNAHGVEQVARTYFNKSAKDLNLSEASKELYIHRNTLIYRLDKIQKYTNYDIREFNDAVLLKIIFFIWKEKNEKKLEDVLKVV